MNAKLIYQTHGGKFYKLWSKIGISIFPLFVLLIPIIASSPGDCSNDPQHAIQIKGDSVTIVNENVSSNTSGTYINLFRTTIPASTPDNTMLGIQKTFTIPFVTTHLKKGDYYFRVGARTSVARYNYIAVIGPITVH